MISDTISRVLDDRYYRPFTTALLGVTSVVIAATAGSLAGIKANTNYGTEKVRTVKYSDIFDVIHVQRVRFAALHGVADPTALVAAVRHSAMANLLISVAIEESLGDPVAVGSAGEQGAWQVIASDWGAVPKDMPGQAVQAERIICALLINANGDKRKALARYNGGPTPSGKSYRYAERILKRARHLQVAVNYLPPKRNSVRMAAL
ncbi:MAG: lytic transglycosylase domain-containing protein [Deltaproteobacteria bacterium]|jgi:hypothetical protein|nr:lytic transglycosylase domain-containing protein [Deltaproteobacteria bacterium]